jgi:hypothetical protein
LKLLFISIFSCRFSAFPFFGFFNIFFGILILIVLFVYVVCVCMCGKTQHTKEGVYLFVSTLVNHLDLVVLILVLLLVVFLLLHIIIDNGCLIDFLILILLHLLFFL